MDDKYLKKVKNGDHNAFRYFVKKYSERAYNISFSILKNQTDAEDALQEAFLKAYKSIKSFKGTAAFSTWLFRIVINEALKLSKRKNQEKQKIKELTEKEVETTIDSIYNLHVNEQKKFIRHAIRQLPSNETLIMNLFYVQENSVKEITELTGWTESNIKVILHRARKRLYCVLNVILKSEIKSILQNE